MNKHQKAWIICNALFVCALNAAAWMEIYWLSVAVVAFVWFAFVVSVAAFLNRNNESRKPPVPVVAGYAVDVLVLFPLLFNGWYLTAFAYFLGAVLQEFIYGRIKLPPKKLSR